MFEERIDVSVSDFYDLVSKVRSLPSMLKEADPASFYFLEESLPKNFLEEDDGSASFLLYAGANLLRILESRLDNVVYRAGYAMSRKEARQLVLHRHFTVNGQTVNIPSYLLKAGDVIAVRDTDCVKLKECVEKNASRPVPVWMTKDTEHMSVTVDRLPERSEIDLEVAEHLIVELYSK